MLYRLLVLGLMACSCWGHAAPLFTHQTVQGIPLQVPAGWQVAYDDYSITVSEDPADELAATTVLVAVQSPDLTPLLLWQNLAQSIQGEAVDSTFNPLVQQYEPTSGALYHLYQVQSTQTGFLSALVYRDSASGYTMAFLFAAVSEDFMRYGGPILPMVVFGSQPPALIDQAIQAITNPVPNTAETQQALADLQRSHEMASAISRWSHEMMMKSIYSIDGDWCYQGEPGCH